MSGRLLQQLRDDPTALGPFALVLREEAGVRRLQIFQGEAVKCANLTAIPLPGEQHAGAWTLAMLPYRQLSERGFACIDDGEPLWALQVRASATLEPALAMSQWPEVPARLEAGDFDHDDAAYAAQVARIQREEIAAGQGSNFVIRRRYRSRLREPGLKASLAAFRRLAIQEQQSFWTFLVHDGERSWLGASPERHLSLQAGIAGMNPISGTWRYPMTGADEAGLLQFLADPKERDELFMVVDEELKMMATLCQDGVRVEGPRLRLMSRLAHTEYRLHGPCRLDPRLMLRHTLFSPAVTGSPIENACRVIARHETCGRGYYAGVLALFGRDARRQRWLDSAILIRTAEIDRSGALQLGVGATIVRHSDPLTEARECRGKAAAVLAAFHPARASRLDRRPAVRAALAARNRHIAPFWLRAAAPKPGPAAQLQGRRLLIMDGEDGFTGMLAQQLRGLGLQVAMAAAGELPAPQAEQPLLLFGPGPGDPLDRHDVRIGRLRQALQQSLRQGRPLLAVCLSHQLLCLELGLPLERLQPPNQGLQARIDYYGRPEIVGFYNTFCARSSTDWLYWRGRRIQVCRDPLSQAVHALRGPGLVSTQFHPESILTRNGPQLLAEALEPLLGEWVPAGVHDAQEG